MTSASAGVVDAEPGGTPAGQNQLGLVRHNGQSGRASSKADGIDLDPNPRLRLVDSPALCVRRCLRACVAKKRQAEKCEQEPTMSRRVAVQKLSGTF
jgi:hypothetical protein